MAVWCLVNLEVLHLVKDKEESRKRFFFSGFLHLTRLIIRTDNKTMNKITRLPLILITLLTIGCGGNTSHIPEEPDEKGIKHVSFGIYADYGTHIEDKVTLLLGSSLIPFNKDKYNIDTLVVGDFVEIDFTGELYIQETYPSTWVMNRIKIKDVRVTHGKVLEYEVTENEDGEKSLKALSDNSYDIASPHVINEDATYTQYYVSLPIGTKIYGVNPSHFASKTILAFYSYNPLAD